MSAKNRVYARVLLTLFFFFFLGFEGSAGVPSSVALLASPSASASVNSPGTALLPRLPGFLLIFLSFFSFWSAGFASSTIT